MIGLIFFIFGLVFGSFFNVCIYRIPREENIAFPPSHCANCSRELKAYELIPVISYIALGGKCKGCKERISFIYPLVELITAFTFLVMYIKFGISINTFKYIVLFSILIIATIIDIKTKEVYFNVSLFGFLFGIIFSIIEIVNGKPIIEGVISILIPLIIVGIIYLLAKRFDGFGGGDLEVYLFIALYLTPTLMGLTIFFSIVIGGVFAIVLLLMGKRKMAIPFVPFISIGTLISVLWGIDILNIYLSTL
ncbi:prepilin peptidase [Clostridium sardiniense]|uniref:Prepilin peptidase n=1 Tax=Clostridium sardiniense TaxID=29369 RepID=A0ABS7KUB7_CLOSR|nr:A24 family peptidase [Clostridium sardiniense]MBY0754404.1 prepilin peptidase [Clostridium sardiniense]MDQ0461279.1 leader peptidase (prepilin peptidase)/N-methyltransferase [Clostridium sardiniense]